MVYVLFEVIVKEAYKDRYLELAAGIRDALQSSEGFIRSERFASLVDQRKILSLSVWQDENAVRRWRQQSDHRQAQREGRDLLFESYRITVTQNIRSYTLNDREEAPCDSNVAFGIPIP